MKQTTTKLVTAAALLAAAAFPAASQHQMHHGSGSMDQSKMGNMQRDMDAAGTMADGEVRKVDKSTGRVTLRHGAIRHMDMPPMTMAFEVKDRAVLDALKVGDKVKFKLSNDSGKMIITDIEPAD